MTYTPTVWNPGIAPGISAANLNHLETQYAQAIAASPMRVLKLANQIVNNSVVLVNDTHLLFPVLANEVWGFTLFLRTTTPSVNPDIDVAFTVPALGAIYQGNFWGAAPETELDGTAELRIALAAATNEWSVLPHIYVGGANAGNVQLQWAQGAAVAENTTVLQNSYILGSLLA